MIKIKQSFIIVCSLERVIIKEMIIQHLRKDKNMRGYVNEKVLFDHLNFIVCMFLVMLAVLAVENIEILVRIVGTVSNNIST